MTNLSDGATRSGGRSAVIHLPHAATGIPLDVREQFVLTDEQFSDEIRLMTDHLTDELFAVPEVMALAVRFPVSRLVVDPERFESDEQEPMAARGMGVVYERTCRQTPLRRCLIATERQALLDRWYRPHHRALTAAVATVLEARDSCLIIDAHSFPSIPLPYEANQDPDRPDICIGSNDFHTPPALTSLAVRLWRQVGWTVAVNRGTSSSTALTVASTLRSASTTTRAGRSTGPWTRRRRPLDSLTGVTRPRLTRRGSQPVHFQKATLKTIR